MVTEVPTLDVERQLLREGGSQVLIAIDEVGRGALAGPVTLGAVMVNSETSDPPPGVRDSKQITAKKRAQLVPGITNWAKHTIVHVSPQRIDHVGITRALGEGAVEAVLRILASEPHFVATVLLDGNFDYVSPVDDTWRVCTVIRGDAVCASIAAASILAKEARDAMMRDLHGTSPQYGWDRNVGYGTALHRAAIGQWGVTPHHRRTWKLT
jgi:ribonuclease HII